MEMVVIGGCSLEAAKPLFARKVGSCFGLIYQLPLQSFGVRKWAGILPCELAFYGPRLRGPIKYRP